MDIDLLGRFAVRRDGRAVEAASFGGRRVRQLVRILAAERGHVVTRDVLIDALWGEQLPADPASNLNVVVNRARRALGEPDVIQTAGNGYLLRSGPDIVVDAEEFETCAGRAGDGQTKGDFVAAASAAQSALQLWGNPFQEDTYAEWARLHRDRLERLHQDTLEVAAAAALATGDTRRAVTMAAEAISCQPLREAAHVLLIRALAADGDQVAALSAYLYLRRVLADELGIEPTPESTALYEQLLRGEPRRPAVRTEPRARVDSPLMVGREAELEELAAMGSPNRIAVVSGRSGIGKSRLLGALCARSERQVLLTRALLPERDEPWSLVRALLQTAAAVIDVRRLLGATTLAALVELLPDLGPAGPLVDAQTRRALIQQGLLRVVEATAPSLVVVDDLQWADSSSLDILALLAGRSADVAMVLAYRPEEVADQSPVAGFLTVIAEARPLDVPLGPLSADALERLVTSAPAAAALAEHTDGTPFAVLQVARTLEREGLLQRTSSGAWDVVGTPALDRVRELAQAGQRNAVWRQFERLPRNQRELIGSLALLGRPVPARLLSTACRVEVDDALRMLSDLARNHLVRHDAEGFRVDHDLIGETVRDRVARVERARLHHLLANALERTGGPVDELARHLAGTGDLAAAAAAYARAAAARLDRFANHEARQLATEGLALSPAAELRTALLEVRAETYARQDDLDAARRDLRAALAEATSRPVRSRLMTRLAALTAGAEDLLRAAELADLALAEAGDDPGARARAIYVRALVDMNFLRRERAEAGLDEALELFTAVGDANGVADILDARAMMAFGDGDISGGIEAFDRVAKLFTDSGNLLRVVTPRSTRGNGLWFAGRPHESLHETGAALELARTLGYAEGEAMVLWHHAEALVACQRPEEGVAAAKLGVAIARRLGHRAWTAATLCALGLAHHAVGDLDGATAAYEASLRMSGEHLVMFRSWAHSRLALVRLEQGRYDAAAAHVDQALAIGPGLALYEARLAQCELAVHRGHEDAVALIEEALRLAATGGHASSAARLAQLLNDVATP